MNCAHFRTCVGVVVFSLLLQLVGAPIWAADIEVFPTGVYPDDHYNVQAAVDVGETILLKATNASGEPTAFNFGPPVAGSGRVIPLHDVTILGETVDGNMTTIQGGNSPFLVITEIATVFRNLHFDGPRSTAVRVVRSTGLEVSDCWIHDVEGAPIFGTTGVLKAQGVWVNGVAVQITGRIIIKNNVMEDMHAPLSYGIALYFFDAESIVTGNYFAGANSAGILNGFHTQPALIEDNVVIPGPERYVEDSAGNGILSIPEVGIDCRIARNLVICENPIADGILLVGGPTDAPILHTQVENNVVEMQNSSFGAITLYGSVSHSCIMNNKVRGTGAYGLNISTGFWPEEIATNNSFVGNNIAHFHSVVPSALRGDMADVFFEVHAQNNLVYGHNGTVIDLGTGNRIVGFTKGGMTDELRRWQEDCHQKKHSILDKIHAAELSAQQAGY